MPRYLAGLTAEQIAASPTVRAGAVAALEDAADVAPTGAWDFTQAPTVAGQPLGSGGGGDATLAGTQTFTGNKTFAGGLTSTSLTNPLRSTTYFGLGAGVGGARILSYQNSVHSGTAITNDVAAGGGDDYVGAQINIRFVGGYAHLIQSRTGGMTSGSNVLTLTAGTFTSPIKVDYWVVVPGAGPSGGSLKARITAITSTTTATLSAAASTTVSGAAVTASLAPDPNFLFGANDFFTTGTAAGDLSGITELWGRLVETHLYTPGATLNNMYGSIAQAAIEATATGASIAGRVASLRVDGVRNSAAIPVAQVMSLFSTSPQSGAGTAVYNVYADGTAANFFGGKITANDGINVGGGASAFKVLTSVTTPNVQAAAAGVYAGTNAGAPAIELADGTSNWRMDNSAGVLRFLRAGVSSDMELSAGGHLKTKGGVGFFNTAPITSKPTVTGSRGGNAGLASLLTTLASTGLLIDGTTA